MDLNAIPPSPAAAGAPRLVAVRRRAEPEVESLQLPDLPVFDGGEALTGDGDDGQDDALDMPADLEEPHGFDGYRPEESVQDALNRTFDAVGEHPAMEPHPGLVEKGEPGYTRHLCPVTPCGWYLDVPPAEVDLSSLFGGVSSAALHQAEQVEQLLEHHLEGHSVIEWATALRAAQRKAEQAEAALHELRPAPGIRVGVDLGREDAVVIPGPVQRDPARAAAVAAVDRRLGRHPATQVVLDQEAAASRDDAIRAEFARKRAQTLAPTDLTPRWSQDLANGVVGIKR